MLLDGISSASHEKGGAVPDWYTGAPFGLARPRGSAFVLGHRNSFFAFLQERDQEPDAI